MKYLKLLPVSTCLIWIAMSLPQSTIAQCELVKGNIENVRSSAMQVLVLSDTLEVFVHTVTGTKQYRKARANTRKAQIYSGEILASTYRAVSTAVEARKRAGTCGVSDVEKYLGDALIYAEKARDQAEQAFGYAKRAYSSRSVQTMQNYLQKSLAALEEAQKAATSVAYAASEAHFSQTDAAIVAAGKGR